MELAQIQVRQMDARQILKNAEIKPSVQRLAVMNYLVQHRTHPTVDEIYSNLCQSIPTLSKTTIYNTLKLLVDGGVAQMLTIQEHNSCFDADVTPHSHFLCKKCGKVFDMQYFDFKNEIPQDVDGNHIEETYQFFKGTCKNCKKNNNI